MEAWPLTGWRLFSERRHATQAGWSAVEILPDGAERSIEFPRLGRGFTGALHVMSGFPSMEAVERDDVCRSWLDALRATSMASAPEGVRVYRTQSALDGEHRPSVTERVLVHECR